MGTEGQNQQQPIPLKITEQDLIVCMNCGSRLFVQTIQVARVKSPIIGQKPMMISNPSGLSCASCGQKATDNTQTVGEIESENNPGGEKPIQ